MCFMMRKRGVWRPSPPPTILPSLPFTRRERWVLILSLILSLILILLVPLAVHVAEQRAADRAQELNRAHARERISHENRP